MLQNIFLIKCVTCIFILLNEYTQRNEETINNFDDVQSYIIKKMRDL